MDKSHSSIKSFQDLRVYQNLYKLMIIVIKEIVPRLPAQERYDLKQQMIRACKAPPALLAEGFAKRYQPKNWKKYLNDCLGEVYEMINHLSVCIDVYENHIDAIQCRDVNEKYNFASKQLYRLREAWTNFHTP